MTGTAPPSAAPEAPPPEQVGRFAEALARLNPAGGRVGLAVSGGPDSLAMLLLAHAAIPGEFEVATVDHGLRAESAGEADFVAGVCKALDVPHATIEVTVPEGNVQDEARRVRYSALSMWAERRGLAAIVTAHHADDQAETVLMRLNRGSGLAGLSGVRARGPLPNSRLPLLRPLLDWRRNELATIVARAGLDAVDDPSNVDPKYDRARLRAELAGAGWLDPAAIARSAANLADAEEALAWAVEVEWDAQVAIAAGAIGYEPAAPRAIVLRVVERIIAGFGGEARGGSVARLVDGLEAGEPGTLAGVAARVEQGEWVFRPEPPRRS